MGQDNSQIVPSAAENKMAIPPKAVSKQSQKASSVVLAPPPPRDVTQPVETTLLKDQDVIESLHREQV